MFESDYFPRLYCFQIYLKHKENTVHIPRYYEDRCEGHRESTDWMRQGMNALLIRQGHKEKCNVLPKRGILSVLISLPLCSREPLRSAVTLAGKHTYETLKLLFLNSINPQPPS